MLIHMIAAVIPNFEKLGFPEILKEVIMNKRGLALVVGGLARERRHHLRR
ncbi:MAG: hypothetical protein ACKO1K_12375 [Burkholderiales bacterium]